MRFTCANGQAVVHLPDGPPPESALRRGPD